MPNFLPDPAKAVRIGNVVLGPLPVKILTSLMAVDDSGLVYSAQSIQSYPIDIFEWRADWFDNKDPHHLRATAYKIKHNAEKPIIFTMRTVREGGMADLDEDAYFSCVNEIGESGLMDAVDVEIRRDRAVDLIKNAHAAGTPVIASFHNFAGTPSKDDILSVMKRMNAAGADIFKVSVMPQKPEDVITLMQATIEARRQFEQPMFTMAMGELGSPTRISGALFGSCATFAAGLAASAPGQIPVSMVSAILKQLRPSR